MYLFAYLLNELDVKRVGFFKSRLETSEEYAKLNTFIAQSRTHIESEIRKEKQRNAF